MKKRTCCIYANSNNWIATEYNVGRFILISNHMVIVEINILKNNDFLKTGTSFENKLDHVDCPRWRRHTNNGEKINKGNRCKDSGNNSADGTWGV